MVKKVTVAQAAKMAGLTPRQVYYAIAIKVIKPKQIADIYFLTPSHINKLREMYSKN